MQWLNDIDPARLVLFLSGCFLGLAYERGRWRLGARRRTVFQVGRRFYFASDITEQLVKTEDTP